MPKRANLFQDVVSIVYELINPDALGERSAMIPHDQTGFPREIDLRQIVRSPDGSVTFGIEAIGRSRKATQEWVEQQQAKHAHLGTDQLILVSDKGFAETAQRLAEANDIITVTPTDIESGSIKAQIVSRATKIYPRALEMWIDRFALVFAVAEGDEPFIHEVPPEMTLVLADGRPIGRVYQIADKLLGVKGARALRDAGITNGNEDRDGVVNIPLLSPRAIDDSGEEVEMWAPLTVDGEDCRVAVRAIIARTTYKLRVSEVPLRHRHIAGVDVAYAEAHVFGEIVTFVASASDGTERLNVEVRETSAKKGEGGVIEELYSAFPQSTGNESFTGDD